MLRLTPRAKVIPEWGVTRHADLYFEALKLYDERRGERQFQRDPQPLRLNRDLQARHELAFRGAQLATGSALRIAASDAYSCCHVAKLARERAATYPIS